MSRFVVLEHVNPRAGERQIHWDWMFEGPEGLNTWGTLPVPEFLVGLAEPKPDRGETGQVQPGGPAVSVATWKLPLHRKMYLDYEGEISGDRGVVSRLSWGDYVPLESELGWHRYRVITQQRVWIVEIHERDERLRLSPDR